MYLFIKCIILIPASQIIHPSPGYPLNFFFGFLPFYLSSLKVIHQYLYLIPQYLYLSPPYLYLSPPYLSIISQHCHTLPCLFWCKYPGPLPESMKMVIPLIHRFNHIFWIITSQGWRVDYCGRYRFCSKRVISLCKEFSGANWYLW